MPKTNNLSQFLLTFFGVLKEKDKKVIKRGRSGKPVNKLIICVLAVLVLAVSFVNVGIVNAQANFLKFPLSAYTPYNVPISSIFDHSIDGQTVDSIPRSEESAYEGLVVAYTGERGSGSPTEQYECYQQKNGYNFILHGNYLGVSQDKTYLCYDGHPAYDYPVPTGTDVYAAASGEVIEAGTDSSGAIYAKIKHIIGGEEFHTLYYHLDQVFVTVGDVVTGGVTIVGKSGCSGICTGPHLHFQVRKVTTSSQVSVDPYGWEGQGVLWDIPLPSCTDNLEPNDYFGGAYGPLSSGSDYSGKICNMADQDFFMINIANSGTISLSLSVPSSKDYDMELYNSSYVRVDGSFNPLGTDESITYSANTAGAYYVRIYGWKGDYEPSLSYTLTGTWPTTDLPAPKITNQSIDKLSVAVGEPFKITVSGENIGGSTADYGGIAVQVRQAYTDGVEVSESHEALGSDTTNQSVWWEGDTLGNGYTAQYLHVEPTWNAWTAGSAKTVAVTITPHQAGTYGIYTKMYLYDGSSYPRDPSGSTPNTDHQGEGTYYVGTVTVGSPSSDTTPPTGSISINSNVAYTKSTSVTLTISATDDSSGVSQMCISNTASCSSWESYATSKAWTLPSGDGTKTVYVWFKDSVGNANTSPYSDSIVLDTTAPTDGILSASAGNGQVLLNWNGSDTTSGINGYKLVYSTSSTPSFCSDGIQIYSGPGTSYTHSSLTNGTTYYYRVCATDNAGNVSIGATAQSTPLGTEQYQLITSVNPVGSGNVNPDCSGGCWYNSGTLVTLAATAESGYTFSSWSGDSDCSDGQITMDNNKTCTANFTEQSKTGSIRVSIIPQEAVNAGAQWKLITESTWRNSGTIKANVPFGTYQVEFKPVTGWNTPPNKEVAISIVNPDVWIDSDPYTQQAGTLSITTTPVSGNIYVDGTYKGTGSWSSSVSTGSYTVSFGDVSGYNTPSAQTVTVYAGQTTTVTGTYTQLSSQYQLTTSVNPTGSGSVDPDCSGGCWYGSGTPVTLTATENSLYTFSGWNGCDSSSGTTCYVTMNNDKTVTATFTLLSQIFLQPGPEDGMDIWISSYYDYNDDYGVNDYRLKVGGWADYYHTLIRFDISGLPSNVNSAKIYLYAYGNNGGSNVSMYLDRITDIWTEDTGWNDRPSYANISTISSPILDTWYSIDITDLYKAWQNNAYENHGIQLRPTSNNNQFNEFYSSNYMDDPSLRPKLVIEVPVPQANISLSPANHDFGSVTVGSQSASQVFTILNTGSANLAVTSLSLTGTDASEFSIQNDNCSSQTLLPVGTCTVDVVFSPTSADTKSAILAIASNDLETPVLDIPLSGTGVSALVPDITVSDSVAPNNDLRVPFGDITTGNSSDKTITVSNDGTGILELNDIAQANKLADPFSILNDNCSWQTLAPSEKCTLTVRFSPNTEGIFNDTFDIPSNDPDENPVTVSVSGTGLPSVINTPPTAPELISPSNGATDLSTTVIFKWKPSTDPDRDPVTYDLYYCENQDFSGCSPVEVASLKNSRETYYAGIGYGAGILLFGIVFAGGIRDRKKIMLLIAMILITGVLLVSCSGSNDTVDNIVNGDNNDTGGSGNEVSRSVTGLSPLTTYYWKVVAKDDNGGETESDIYTFTTTDK